MKLLLIGGLGYIGSYLYNYLTSLGMQVSVCDDSRRLNPGLVPCHYPYNYNDLSAKELIKYDAILWFAGHSSVKVATQDPKGAITNNMTNLLDLLQKISSVDTKFIFASTASLYSGEKGLASESAKVLPNENAYDISKFAFDYLSQSYHPRLYGLRMGTLAGYSQNLRSELIFNQMCLSAHFKGKLNIANKTKFRSLLFLSDLAEIIKILLTEASPIPGFYNCASHSSTIGELGGHIADYFSAKIIELPDSDTYSFQIDTSKIASIGFKNTYSLRDQIDIFVNSIQTDDGKWRHLVA